MAVAGAGVLAVVVIAIVISFVRANRDADAAHEWLAQQARAAEYERERREREQRAVARVSPRPVSTTERDPTRELIRHRCPRCNAPAARDAAGMLRCLQGCRTDSIRGHRWAD